MIFMMKETQPDDDELFTTLLLNGQRATSASFSD